VDDGAGRLDNRGKLGGKNGENLRGKRRFKRGQGGRENHPGQLPGEKTERQGEEWKWPLFYVLSATSGRQGIAKSLQDLDRRGGKWVAICVLPTGLGIPGNQVPGGEKSNNGATTTNTPPSKKKESQQLWPDGPTTSRGKGKSATLSLTRESSLADVRRDDKAKKGDSPGSEPKERGG